MKYTIAILLAVSPVTFGVAYADSIADKAKANCVKAIMSSSAQVTRGMVAKFKFSKTGEGYELEGLDENRNMVTCKTAADGHVTWVFGG